MGLAFDRERRELPQVLCLHCDWLESSSAHRDEISKWKIFGEMSKSAHAESCQQPGFPVLSELPLPRSA